MEKYSYVNKTMIDTVYNTKGRIVNEEIRTIGLSFLKLRDLLFSLGKIITENVSEQSYVAIIKSGFLKLTSVILVLQLQSKNVVIAAYSVGAINREKVCKGAINELRSKIEQCVG